MCDLWQYTTESDTPRGAIPAQIDDARRALESSGDRHRHEAVQRRQLLRSACGSRRRLRRYRRPPRGPRARHRRITSLADWRPRPAGFSTALESNAGLMRPAPALEVAMGLETAHPDALERLHKRMTVDGFGRRSRANCARSALRSACSCWFLRRLCRTPSRTTGCCAPSTSALAARRIGDLAHPDAHRKWRARGARRPGLVSPADAGGPRAKPRRSRSRTLPAAARASSPTSGIWSDSRPARTVSMPRRRATASDEPRTARAAAACSAPPVPRNRRSYDAIG